jgi:hypothetical protein
MERNCRLPWHGIRPGVAVLHLTPTRRHGTFIRFFQLPDSPMGKISLSACHVRRIAAASVLVFGLLAAADAQAANFWQKNFGLFGPRYDGTDVPCEAALDDVAARFAEKESTFWNSSLTITQFLNVHEIAYRPWQSDTIPRRYCTATAVISDGKPRIINFSIIEDGGLMSIGPGVEFCVVGLDRNWAYNPTCRMARP